LETDIDWTMAEVVLRNLQGEWTRSGLVLCGLFYAFFDVDGNASKTARASSYHTFMGMGLGRA